MTDFATELGGILEGTFLVRNAIDKRIIFDFTEITGDLLSIGLRDPRNADGFFTPVAGLTSIVLPNLEVVGGSVTLFGSQIVNLEGFLKGRHDMQTIQLDGLATVATNFIVLRFEILTTLSFASLTTVGGDLQVRFNNSLSSFDASSLDTVGGNFVITNNESLSSLASLGNLTRIDGDLQIQSNPNLCNDDALALRDQVLAADGIGGSVIISGNGSCP